MSFTIQYYHYESEHPNEHKFDSMRGLFSFLTRRLKGVKEGEKVFYLQILKEVFVSSNPNAVLAFVVNMFHPDEDIDLLLSELDNYEDAYELALEAKKAIYD